jgi:hypothetical protein
MNMSMLPYDQRVFFQIGYVIERRFWPELEQKPADVRMEKSFADVVRIFVMVDMFMMPGDDRSPTLGQNFRTPPRRG